MIGLSTVPAQNGGSFTLHTHVGRNNQLYCAQRSQQIQIGLAVGTSATRKSRFGPPMTTTYDPLLSGQPVRVAPARS